MNDGQTISVYAQGDLVKSQLEQMIESKYQISTQFDDLLKKEGQYDDKTYKKMVFREILSEKKGVILVMVLFVVNILISMISLTNIIQSIILLDTSDIDIPFFLRLLYMLLMLGVWCWSTKYDEFCYKNVKLFLFKMVIVGIAVQLWQFLVVFLANIIFPVMVRFPTNEDITISMVCSVGRLLLGLFPMILIIALFSKILAELKEPLTRQVICGFYISDFYDSRKDKKYAYDMNIVRNLDTSQKYSIYEKDRFLHSLANGVTGTGKTSMCFTTAIYADMDKIIHNKECQKKDCKKLLEEGRIKLKYPLKDEDFTIDAFVGVTKEDDALLQNIRMEKKVAGITAIAPDASFSDEIYKMARLKGLKVNRIDPVRGEDGLLKSGYKGFNPLYITSGLDEMEYIIEAGRKAVLFADVLQALFDSQGSGDIYFASLNKNITTTVTMMVVLTSKAVNNRTATIEDVQRILNTFSSIVPYRNEFVNRFSKRTKKGNILYDEYGIPVMIRPLFQTLLDVVDNELLGMGAEKMYDQCRGLRVLINTLLTNFDVAHTLCTEDSIDMDEALEQGQITLINFALELGSSGRGLGLFFMLNLINAAYRRPGSENTRIPNFCYIDEFPQLLHPMMEQCFVLFRKYRIAMFVAVQSLSQMEKDKSMAFMKQILIGNCAHHFVYGRSSTEEMELYEKLAGKEHKIIEMRQVNETSITSDNPTISFGNRFQDTIENSIEGKEFHDLRFQQVAVVTVKDGTPQKIFFGKMNFLPRYKTKFRKRMYQVDWSKYYNEDTSVKKEMETMLDNKKFSSTISNTDVIETVMKTTSRDVFCEQDTTKGDKHEEEKRDGDFLNSSDVFQDNSSSHEPAFLKDLKKNETNDSYHEDCMENKEVRQEKESLEEKEKKEEEITFYV